MLQKLCIYPCTTITTANTVWSEILAVFRVVPHPRGPQQGRKYTHFDVVPRGDPLRAQGLFEVRTAVIWYILAQTTANSRRIAYPYAPSTPRPPPPSQNLPFDNFRTRCSVASWRPPTRLLGGCLMMVDVTSIVRALTALASTFMPSYARHTHAERGLFRFPMTSKKAVLAHF